MDGASAVIGIGSGCAAALVAIKSLVDTVQRYQDRDKALQRLKDLLAGLTPILDSLRDTSQTITSISALLQGPIDNCSQICADIESAMKRFDRNPKPNRRPGSATKMTLVDWGRMEISRGNLNDGIDILEGYKSTIAIGLSILNLGQAKVTEKVVNEFTDTAETTIRHLELQLQRIEEKLEDLATSPNEEDATATLDLENESIVITQCIQLCNKASDYLQKLCVKQSPVLKGSQQGLDSEARKVFESQISTQKALSKSQQTLAMQISDLTSRLTTLQSLDTADPEREGLRAQLEKDFETSRQCIEICNLASETVSSHKVHIFGDVTAEEDCDQVVVANLADMFSIGKTSVGKGSMQWVGSVDSDVAKQISMDRYRSRSMLTAGAADAGSSFTSTMSTEHDQERSAPRSFARHSDQEGSARQGRQVTWPPSTQGMPMANEVRKRGATGEHVSKINAAG